jgi:N,N-dimethylformamidase
MVSTLDKNRPFTAGLVKVINGDDLTRYHEAFRLVEVDAEFKGEYQGKVQPLDLGSYVHVEKTGPIDDLKSFSVAAWIYPTFDPTEYTAPDLNNIDPFSPPTLTIANRIVNQAIISRFDEIKGLGWVLQLNAKYQLEFAIGDGDGKIKRIRTDQKLNDWDWAYVAATYDTNTKELKIYAMEKPFAPGDQFLARTLSKSEKVDTLPHTGPLRIAATRAGAGASKDALEKPGSVFAGRIQDVRLANRVLNEQGLDRLSAQVVPESLAGDLVVVFDFGRGITTHDIIDISPSQLKGELVNVGERGVRGRFWDGTTIRWTDNPDLYDAISFYSDDLYDAQWEPSFSYTVPADLDSGIYAIRLTCEGFSDYVSLFVAAPKGEPQAKLAVWLSDYNYLAYANITIGVTAAKNYPGQNLSNRDSRFLLKHLEYGTGGAYNTHIDGRYFIYGSRKRPDIGTKPSGLYTYNFMADTHITAFLKHERIPYDIITDELLDREGGELLKQYQVVISSTHHEYVPGATLDHVADFTANGGRFMYIGGNGWFWSVAQNPAFPGVMETRNFSDVADRYLTNGERGGLMVETGRHTGPVFGNEMGGMVFNGSSPYRKLEDAKNPRAAWIFEGTKEGKVFGDYGIDRVKGGAAGFEIDVYKPNNGAPRHTLHLATAEPLKPKIEDVKLGNLPLTIAYHPSDGKPWADADLLFFETPKGGAMFSTGSITWISSTLENNFDNDVAVITRNVIKRFLDVRPFPPVGQEEVDPLDRVPSNPEYEWADQQ